MITTKKKATKAVLTPTDQAAKTAQDYMAKKKAIEAMSADLDALKDQLVNFYTQYEIPPQGLTITVVYQKPQLAFDEAATKTLIEHNTAKLMAEFPEFTVTKATLNVEALAAEMATNARIQNSLLTKKITIKMPEPGYRIGIAKGS
jgi:hypothetical protein